jgi:hypothetical protein
MKQGSTIHSSRAWGIALAVASFAVALSPISAPQADNGDFQVVPGVFDPANTDLVQAAWLSGIGCPTNAGISTTSGKKPDTSYTDPACATGDPKDKNVEGLLLAKTGPTTNVAAAGAVLKGLPNFLRLTELGYDIRKPVDFSDPRGSHCGAGAPRFNVTTSDNVLHFVGCASPPPVSQQVGNGWLRLRWDPATAFPPITAAETVTSIQIVFDEGQDAGPDLLGAAILDNIDVNGVLVGRGPDEGAH